MTATDILEQAAENLDNAQAVVHLSSGAPADVRAVAEAAYIKAQALFQIVLARVMRGNVSGG